MNMVHFISVLLSIYICEKKQNQERSNLLKNIRYVTKNTI